MDRLVFAERRGRWPRLGAAALGCLLLAGPGRAASARPLVNHDQAGPPAAPRDAAALERRLLRAAQVVDAVLLPAASGEPRIARTGDGRLLVLSDPGGVIGAVPERADVTAQVALLGELARRRGAAARLRGDGKRPPAAIDEWSQELLQRGHAFASLALLQRQAQRQGRPDAALLQRAAHLLCATAFVGGVAPARIGEAAEPDDGGPDDDALAAAALGVLGVLRATPSSGDMRTEEAMLAQALGHAVAAQRLALQLPADEPLRAFLLRDRARLAAAAQNGTAYTRYLAQRDQLERSGESGAGVLDALGAPGAPGTLIYTRAHRGDRQPPALPLLSLQLWHSHSASDLRAERAVGAAILLRLLPQLSERPRPERVLPRPPGRLSPAELLLLLSDQGLSEPAAGGLAQRVQAALARVQAPTEGPLLNTPLVRGFLRGHAAAALAALGVDPAPLRGGEALVLRGDAP